MAKKLFLFPLLIASLLTGCSTSTNQTFETLYSAFGPTTDGVELSAEKIRALPYASAYVKVGDGPKAFVVLAYADADTLSWMSQDGVMFVTQHGRLIKTVGLDNDLRFVGNLENDPLVISRLDKSQSISWQSMGEWSKNYTSGYLLSANYSRGGKELLPIIDRHYMTTIVEEKISTINNITWCNYFWIDDNSGQVRKIQQQLGPSLPIIEITYLKSYSS